MNLFRLSTNRLISQSNNAYPPIESRSIKTNNSIDWVKTDVIGMQTIYIYVVFIFSNDSTAYSVRHHKVMFLILSMSTIKIFACSGRHDTSKNKFPNT